jgi:HD-GYP domain-containing protein (c-di-GMP phosphodiesterase class II)
MRLGTALGLTDDALVDLRRGALLHDIGKMAVPDRILLKPEALDVDEWRIMRRHPEYARDMLSHISFLSDAIVVPYCHHERWDGSGYPQGLRGESIPLAARVFAVVDVWDALRANRPYRDPWPAEKAINYISGNSGILFDPRVVAAFLELVGVEVSS